MHSSAISGGPTMPDNEKLIPAKPWYCPCRSRGASPICSPHWPPEPTISPTTCTPAPADDEQRRPATASRPPDAAISAKPPRIQKPRDGQRPGRGQHRRRTAGQPDLEQRDRHRVDQQHDGDQRVRRRRPGGDPQRDRQLHHQEVDREDPGQQRDDDVRDVAQHLQPRRALLAGRRGLDVRQQPQRERGRDERERVEARTPTGRPRSRRSPARRRRAARRTRCRRSSPPAGTP